MSSGPGRCGIVAWQRGTETAEVTGRDPLLDIALELERIALEVDLTDEEKVMLGKSIKFRSESIEEGKRLLESAVATA